MFERTRTGAVHILRGNDPFTLQNTKEIAALLDECFAGGQPRIVFDLEKIPLIDSAGLELLLDYQDRCLQSGGVMKLAAPTPLCNEILTITDLNSHIDVFPDSLAAIGSFVQ